MKRTLLTTALVVTALFGVAHAQSIDAIATKGVKAAAAHPEETCFANKCRTTNSLINPVGFGGPVQIAWSQVDPVYGKFRGLSHWEGAHQCPALNGGPWVEKQAIADVWEMTSDFVDPVHGSCRLLVTGVPTYTSDQVICTNYIMLNGQVRLNGCTALVYQDPIQHESDALACPNWLSSAASNVNGGILLSWHSWGINTTANQSLTWVPELDSVDIHGGSPAMVQLR